MDGELFFSVNVGWLTICTAFLLKQKNTNSYIFLYVYYNIYKYISLFFFIQSTLAFAAVAAATCFRDFMHYFVAAAVAAATCFRDFFHISHHRENNLHNFCNLCVYLDTTIPRLYCNLCCTLDFFSDRTDIDISSTSSTTPMF